MNKKLIIPVLILLNCMWIVVWILLYDFTWTVYVTWLGIHLSLLIFNGRNLYNEHRRRTRDYQRADSPPYSSAPAWSDKSVRVAGTYRAGAYPGANYPFGTTDPGLKTLKIEHTTLYYSRLGMDRRMKEKNRAEPMKGWKVANIYLHPDTGEVEFIPLVHKTPYGVEEHAQCSFLKEVYERIDVEKLIADGWEVTDDHGPVPSKDCTCGFYAMKNPPNATDVGSDRPSVAAPRGGYRPGWMSMGMGMLEVQMYGRIIAATKGYRAEYQQVLCAYTWKPKGTDGKPDPLAKLPMAQVDWKWLDDFPFKVYPEEPF